MDFPPISGKSKGRNSSALAWISNRILGSAAICAIRRLVNVFVIEATDEGSVKWGQTVTTSYLPKDNTEYFEGQTESLVDWIRQFSAKKDDVYLRGFLGRMLFSGDEVFKPVNVLSGGEKVRCMLSRMMLSGANVILLDQPTNHLDMEAIQAVNKGLDAFPGNILLASHDHELLQTTCNRVIEFQPDGKIIDRLGTYDEYLEWKLAK